MLFSSPNSNHKILYAFESLLLTLLKAEIKISLLVLLASIMNLTLFFLFHIFPPAFRMFLQVPNTKL